MTNFKNTKISIETMFQNNWSDTPIQYRGMPFDSSNVDAWISPIYEPTTSYSTSISDTTSISTGNLYIICWAETQFDVLSLADIAVEMVMDKRPKDMIIKKSSIIEQGIDDNGKVFLTIEIPIKFYVEIC